MVERVCAVHRRTHSRTPVLASTCVPLCGRHVKPIQKKKKKKKKKRRAHWVGACLSLPDPLKICPILTCNNPPFAPPLSFLVLLRVDDSLSVAMARMWLGPPPCLVVKFGELTAPTPTFGQNLRMGTGKRLNAAEFLFHAVPIVV